MYIVGLCLLSVEILGTVHLRLCLLSVEILGTVHLRLCLLSVEILGTVPLCLCLLSVEILGTVHLCLCLLSVEILGTVDFVHSDGTVVFRTCAEEKEKVVFQMVRSVLILLFFFVWGNQGWWPFRVNSGVGAQVFFFFDAEKEFLQSKYQGATQVQCMLS